MIGLPVYYLIVESYRDFVSPLEPQKARGTIIVFHGNAGSALDRSYYVHALGRLGYRVILAEYPGYGSRSGKPGENQFTADAVETVGRAAKQFGHPLFLLGESLGCGNDGLFTSNRKRRGVKIKITILIIYLSLDLR